MWPQAEMNTPCSSGQLGHRGQIGGDGGPRDDGVDDVVAAGRLADEEGPLSGRDQLVPASVAARRPRATELFQQGGHGLDVFVDPVGVGALEDDDEVGQGASLDLFGDAEIEVGAAVMPAMTRTSTYSRIGGLHPAGHHVRDSMGDLRPGWRKGPAAWPTWLGRGCTLRVISVVRASVPFGADEQLGQVVTARGLDEFAAGAQHGAVGQHHLEPEHVMAGDAVAHGAHAAGVGGHVAAERGARLAR